MLYLVARSQLDKPTSDEGTDRVGDSNAMSGSVKFLTRGGGTDKFRHFQTCDRRMCFGLRLFCWSDGESSK